MWICKGAEEEEGVEVVENRREKAKRQYVNLKHACNMSGGREQKQITRGNDNLAVRITDLKSSNNTHARKRKSS